MTTDIETLKKSMDQAQASWEAELFELAKIRALMGEHQRRTNAARRRYDHALQALVDAIERMREATR